ncbi:hypothetical protein BGY98DRAFT_1013146 [Russula aff. rugulosa BPL654]|nr:hypothetical protein BGY98DRAFT_1013146 [Russula aff. rugulosa BPL654]
MMSTLDVFLGPLITSPALTFLGTGYPLSFFPKLLSFLLTTESTERPHILLRSTTSSNPPYPRYTSHNNATFALAAPVLVQERHQSYVNEVHVPRAALGKRILSDYLLFMLDDFEDMEGPAEDEPLRNLAEVPVPEVHTLPPNLAGLAEVPELAEPQVPGVHALLAVPGVHVPPDPADFDRESMEFDDDAPPGSPEYGHSPPTSPESTDSDFEDWHTAPSSPRVDSSTESYLNSDH